ncbi:zinc finger protein CONSTANS-LIKE 9-like protein [Cinnamomum micranthum f. kanehirae]|uniref:Zinc finger protein CONSTANS-LIKE 9-like protein n=1 Tax=Cinnamomum micranthum f. kanehirae TaxID=337451 RepID=A0A3S3NEN9_9MAGN|nr:zinc finger protein CONSTANS-LIKE 9-like protein [Cinnamomum micranthum f. kanehirae]
MKECELCNSRAKMYCESDQASLCCRCDAKVHSANFLVARHSRTLLCHTCQSPTPWKASGPSFGPTFSVCNRCFSRSGQRPEIQHQEEEEEKNDEEGDGENDEEEEEDDDLEDEDDDGDDDDDDEEEEEEDGENQVVPWSATPPPLPSSSSSDDAEDSSSSVGRSTADHSLKRARENADLSSQDDLGCTSSRRRGGEDEEETSVDCFRLSKRKATVGSDSKSALIDSLQRFQKVCDEDEEGDVIDISKLSGDRRAVDLVDTDTPSPSI